MEAENQNTSNTAQSGEIDLIEVIRHIWDGRWLIVKVTGIFIVIGLIIAFTSQEKYKAEARLLPEVRDTQGGASALLRQFGGLGGLGGFDLHTGAGADAIRPDLYPDILKSTPFFIYLLEKDVTIKTENGIEKCTVLEYMNMVSSPTMMGKYIIGLPRAIFRWLRNSEPNTDHPGLATFEDIPQMSKSQFDIIKDMRENIKASIDQRSGVISISAEFPDPRVAAQIGQHSVNYLTDYITQYRIGKAQKDLDFIKGRYEDKKNEFHLSQLALANFRDANRNFVSLTAQTEEQRLQDQYNLAFNVFNSLAQQVEQARIKVQEETPVIKILEPVSVPMEKSKPKRFLIISIFSFFGLFSGLLYIYLAIILETFSKKYIANS
jgi:uncharacterized protein involved in exopolysaccharide biosynthesis